MKISFHLQSEHLQSINPLLIQSCPVLQQLTQDPDAVFDTACPHMQMESDSNISCHTQTRIGIRTKGKTEFKAISSIMYLTGQQNYTNIHFSGGKVEKSNKTLKYYEDHFSPELFFRAHKHSLVNLSFLQDSNIEGRKGWLVMDDGTRIDLSQHGQKEFNRLNLIIA